MDGTRCQLPDSQEGMGLMGNSEATRRQFLASVAIAAVGLMLGKRYFTPHRRAQETQLSLQKAELPADGALVYRQARLAIIGNGGAPYAVGLICTHLGCTVSVTPEHFVCPCHGSRFDLDGNVLTGPADRPLPRYPVRVSEQSFIVTLSPLPEGTGRRS